ncbi:transcription elongation factor GreAB [Mycolicibacterium celeriflavum]|uniref:Transcription elongation factor GreA n=1 Tax=Mycolicibacterium celeriflavum TaxID=1249101 RepID=A0A1X0BLC3_MYCCF|nr:GreA/GreB family elongation factor [Mycolicibacterium celeriflavum]MCV7240966.1 GreA/GreB family elongation factor [Mycolicibacterium celeriflavum]OBG22785.1 transcription elongation factor GreAB [Mycolicibacterium celeriflavum]ORA43500.1 transcription elongation factor GreAB [Mycolicibacterium celeriflavum]BBY45586.1 transcription elongation factor GreA [Mycolicibacterium celeriflavum]
MTIAQRIWISPDAYARLQDELATLRELVANAVGEEDAGENASAVKRARQARIREIHEMLINAVVGEDPPDDGIAEPGMVVTVRYDDTAEVETFLLGVRSAEHGDMEVYSVQSPLGAAILGARPGEQRSFKLPSGADLSVTMLTAVPYGLHSGDEMMLRE